jgi:hypothetical protein
MQNLIEDQDEHLIRQKETATKVGYAFSGYTQYWKDSNGFEGLVSYTNLSEVFYGRLRWFYAAYETANGIPIMPGLELLGTGNSEFKAGYAGGLLQTELKSVEILLKGGYQNNTTFHSGAYGGIELYVRF